MHACPSPYRRGGLPADVTSFVGRRQEIADLRRLLLTPGLVTLTGLAGVGKTRLAIRVGSLVRRRLPGGLPSLVECGHLEAGEAAAALDAVLPDGRGLVILDDCEHVLDTCVPRVKRLLDAGTSVLATSRQPLSAAGERTFTVPVLPRTEAVRLFVARAGAVVPRYAPDEADRGVIDRICHVLDDVPLAVELAALRMRALSPEQVLRRLDDRFRLLSSGSRAAPRRHRSLSAAVKVSWDLCTPAERLVWARISVFRGGLDRATAEAVCADLARDQVAPALDGLARKSVLIRDGDRYRVPRTVAAYGGRHLETDAAQARHREYFQRMAATARSRIFGPEQAAWLSRLRLEHDNLTAALETGPACARLRMATDLLPHWIGNHRPDEGRRWLDRGLAECTEPTEARANALCAGGRLASVQSDPAAATALLDESADLARRLGADSLLARTALCRGMAAMCRGDDAATVTFLRDAVAGYRATGDRAGLALALSHLSLTLSPRGDMEQAMTTCEQAAAACEVCGDTWHRARVTTAAGIRVWRQGDARGAAGLVRESLRTARSLDDRLGIGLNLEVLAWIAAGTGAHARAAHLLGALRGPWQTVGQVLTKFGNLAHHHEECVARTRQGLGEAGYRGNLSRGAGMRPAEALAFALDEAAPAGAGSPLTPREREIARLVAKGLSNKDIAAELVIARRTAEGHVEHILKKLGFTSRAEIATWVSAGR